MLTWSKRIIDGLARAESLWSLAKMIGPWIPGTAAVFVAMPERVEGLVVAGGLLATVVLVSWQAERRTRRAAQDVADKLADRLDGIEVRLEPIERDRFVQALAKEIARRVSTWSDRTK